MWHERTVVDSVQAVLVWEPRRVVPSWAVPIEDVSAELVRSVRVDGQGNEGVGLALPDVSRRPVLDPSIPFAVHTTPGVVVEVVDGHGSLAEGLLPADADLVGYVVLDFAGFDTWLEEDEWSIGHPRDPFHRLDVLPSSRHVQLELDGELVAESDRATFLFESMLPVRFYLPREDVRVELVPSATTSTCAYKGYASYLSPIVGGRERVDLAWMYDQPLREASPIAGRIALFDERVDVVLDGVQRERPVTPWS